MVDELILQDMNVDREEIDREVEAAMADPAIKDLDKAIDESIKHFETGLHRQGPGHQHRRRRRGRGRRLQVAKGIVPLNEFADGDASRSRATRSRCCSRPWRTTPA